MTGLDLDPAWLWLIGGVLLLIAEVIAPGFFLVFVGVAAVATGLFTLLFGLGTAPQLALFVVYALLAVAAGRRFYSGRRDSSDPLLNDRAGRLIGKTVTVVAASTSTTAESASATAIGALGAVRQLPATAFGLPASRAIA